MCATFRGVRRSRPDSVSLMRRLSNSISICPAPMHLHRSVSRSLIVMLAVVLGLGVCGVLSCTSVETRDPHRRPPVHASSDASAFDGGAASGSDAETDVADAELQDVGQTDDAARDVGDGADSADTALSKGDLVGTLWNTYYYVADESQYSGGDDTTLYDANCDPVAQVPADFGDALCIEGSGRLEDGTVINFDERCSCGGPCSICWALVDSQEFPWGMGSRANALEPLVSWAVDTDVIAHGSVLYVEAFDGVQIPQVGELGGFVHDGCFRADDVGGGIDGNHFDLFAGTEAMWKELEQIHPTRTDFEVYENSPRCAHLQ